MSLEKYFQRLVESRLITKNDVDPVYESECSKAQKILEEVIGSPHKLPLETPTTSKIKERKYTCENCDEEHTRLVLVPNQSEWVHPINNSETRLSYALSVPENSDLSFRIVILNQISYDNYEIVIGGVQLVYNQIGIYLKPSLQTYQVIDSESKVDIPLLYKDDLKEVTKVVEGESKSLIEQTSLLETD